MPPERSVSCSLFDRVREVVTAVSWILSGSYIGIDLGVGGVVR
jgi:hypothetical protein